MIYHNEVFYNGNELVWTINHYEEKNITYII